jgi:hypothetical protein
VKLGFWPDDFGSLGVVFKITKRLTPTHNTSTTYETRTLVRVAGVAAENLSLVDEARHLSGNSSKAITSPICPMMDPSILRRFALSWV